MKLSIIVPVYNTEKYIDKCLHSLVIQTLEDIEIIVVNDGSTDKSQLIIDKYKDEFPDKLKVYTKKNGGLSDARNFGLTFAKGRYIGFVDSDDFVDKNMYKILFELAVKENADIAECNYANYYPYKGDNVIVSNWKTPQKYNNVNPNQHKSIINDIVVMVWNKIYKRELFTDNNIKFPIGLWYEDSAIMSVLLGEANKYVVCSDIGYYYTQRDNSITKSINVKFLDLIESYFYLINEMKRLEKYEAFKDCLYIKYKAVFWDLIVKAFQHKGYNKEEFSFKSLFDKIYKISILFKDKYFDEKEGFVKEINNAIISRKYSKFLILIYVHHFLRTVKLFFKH